MIDELMAIAKDKLKSKDGKDALSFLKKHKAELSGVGKDMLSRLVAWVGMGEPEKAKDLFLIQYQSADELIEGMAASGDVFVKAHKAMVEKAEKINAMWKSLGDAAAKALLPVLVSML